MSILRQADEPAVRGYSVTHPAGRAVLPTGDGWDQLLYAATGTMTIVTSGGSWTVPPHLALWIPHGAPAAISNRFPVAVRSLYFATELRALPTSVRTINVTGLVRELLLYAVRSCPLDIDQPVNRGLLTVLIDQLHQLSEASLWLPMPAAPQIARAAAELIASDPTMPLTGVAWTVGASQRTLERAFLSATGVTLGAWRRRSRILGSLAYLAAGVPVTQAALEVGYTTPSAFVTAFKRELGQTPGHYVQR